MVTEIVKYVENLLVAKNNGVICEYRAIPGLIKWPFV